MNKKQLILILISSFLIILLFGYLIKLKVNMNALEKQHQLTITEYKRKIKNYKTKINNYQTKLDEYDKKITQLNNKNIYENFDKVFLTGDKGANDRPLYREYTPGCDKQEKYEWYAGIITELNFCKLDSPLFDNISSYNNPIDVAYMEFLNGRGIDCEAARREYQPSYAKAWRDEFYHVATLIYETLNQEEERNDLVKYIKSIDKMIDSKLSERIIDIFTCNITPEDERYPNMYHGNGTWAKQAEEAAYIYRFEAFNMIRQYNNYLNDMSNHQYYLEKGEYPDDYSYINLYQYKNTSIKLVEGMGQIELPEYFK